MEAFGQIVLMFLVLLGIVYLMRIVMILMLSPERENDFVMLVPLKGHREDAELILRSAAARVKWFGKRRTLVTVVDCGMDDETRELCRRLCREIRCAELVSKEEFGRRIQA